MPATKSRICSCVSREITVALILSLLSASTPAAPQTIVALAKESSVSFLFWFHSSGLRKLIQGNGPGNPPAQEKQRDRDAKVSRVQVFPGNVTIDLGDHIRFAAVAYDQNGNPVGGVKIKWRGQSTVPSVHVNISQHGEFEASSPGSFTVIAEAVGRTSQVTVVVRPGIRRSPNSPPTGPTIHVSSRDLPPPKIASSKKQKSLRKAADSTFNGSGGKKETALSAKRAHAPTESVRAEPEPIPQGDGSGGWNDANSWSADDPYNGVGNPPGAAMDGGAGSGNFQFVAPIYSASGRGINISLAAAYNSRVWNKADPQISYDNDRGWPAPGFSLGFGKLLGMGVFHGGMLVDADGTRHAYTGEIAPIQNGSRGIMHTIDGSSIDYYYETGIGGGLTYAKAWLPNGTVIEYRAPGPGAVYPTFIEDANGNEITITYAGINNSGPRIQTVTDTLARTILFYYDSNSLLTAITAPGLDNGPGSNNLTRTLVRFHYHQISLSNTSYSFSGLTPSVRDPNPWVVDAIYYPATGTGYWLDPDSYSSYGMLRKVSERRNMTFSGPDPVPPGQGTTEQGTTTSGLITREELYNYPAYVGDMSGTQSSNLNDAPTYTSMTESGANFDSATTSYEVHENDTPRMTIITLPNGAKSKQLSYNYSTLPDTNPLKALDGLVYHDETYVTEGQPLQSSTSSWEQGDYGSPRPTQVEARNNEIGQSTTAIFSYDGSICGQAGHYNQVFEVQNRGYSGELLRSTHTCYQNDPSYTGAPSSTGYNGRHIFNLPLNVEVYAGDNSRVSRTEYQYDNGALAATAGVLMHDDHYDPYTTDTSDVCCDWEWDPNTGSQFCAQWCPQSVFDPSTNKRGNVTQVTTYADAVSLSGAVTETRGYDVTGNLVTASTSCCEQTTFNYGLTDDPTATQYAYVLSKARGSATDALAQVTTSATYDFNTGLGLSTTDANGRPSITSYSPPTLRPASTISPTGAHTDYAYDDGAMTVTSTTYLAAGAPDYGVIADQSIKLLNGMGQVRQEQARGPDNGANQTWDAVDTIYNNLGQVYQQSQPYRVGSGSPILSTATYDALGRTKTVTAPDGSVTQTFYNEASRPDVASGSPGETTRVQDAWGRERWGRTDASGRLVEVVEPNPGGNGSVANGGLVTYYGYNTLGNLTGISQGAQTRSFAYDSLGRLTAQKLAEASATLNDSGTYVGSGTWSDVFTYDNRSNLTSRTDARGVKTVYSYNNDPLNRLQSVSWDTTGFGDTTNPILSAATVTYQYRHKNTSTDLIDVMQLDTVTTAGISAESYGYDSEGRVDSKTLTVNGRPSMDTNYEYDTLDRIKDVTYPKRELGVMGSPRKVVHHDYDIASRLSQLTVDGQVQAWNIVYNAGSQTTSLNVGTGTNQVSEVYNYNAQTGLLDNQTVARGGATLLNLSYDYLRPGTASGRTGQLTKILNNLNHDKDRGYSYDTLGRLIQATGGQSGSLWTQAYSYDRYGNRTSVSSSGYSAANKSAVRNPQSEIAKTAVSEPRAVATGSVTQPSDPKVGLPTDLIAKNNPVELPTSSRDGGTSLPDSPPTLRAPSTPQSGPPTFTDDPLVAGVTVIKALHLTELRNAINQLRTRAGLGAASWSESITAGVTTIKATHVQELRTKLDDALGALGLATGGYTDPNLIAGTTPVRAVHIQELRDRVKAAWNSSSSIPRDGLGSLSYDTATNRITTSGFGYDAAGNQTRALIPGSTASQRFQYDAANRLVRVKADDNQTVLATYTYGDSNERLIAEENGYRTYYDSEGGSVISEYTESGGSSAPAWSKSYVYLGGRLLSTLTPNGSGGEAIQFHHPDRLGTRLITDPVAGTFFEQQTLPFGTALNESPPTGGTTGETNRRFTSYNRSQNTKLDYAVNRHYDPQQGRFTQVDPAGMSATSLTSPQTLNLYAYCTNDPINQVDPSGLGFFSKLFGVIAKIFKVVLVIAAVVLAVVGTLGVAGMLLPFLTVNGGWMMLGLAAAGFAEAFGPPWLQKTIAIGFTALGIYMMKPGIIWNFERASSSAHTLRQLLGAITTVGSVSLFLQQQNPSPTPPAQPLPPNYRPPKDIEQPCIDRTGDFRRDISGIAKILHGKVIKSEEGHRFPGARIDPQGQSFGTAVSRLRQNGFTLATGLGIQSLDHPEGENFQKQFSDGLWYHVVVNSPNNGNPNSPAPLVTAHCHATDPTGLTHIIDRIFGP